jgi:hypothetical protein
VQGDYVAWVDADDVILPEKLKTQIAALEPLGDVPAMSSSEVLVERTTENQPPTITDVFSGLNGAEELADTVTGRRGFPPCGYLLNRAAARLLAESGGFLGVRCQDREYFARARLLGIRGVHVPEVLSVYRDWSKAQVTNSLDRMLWAPALARCYESLGRAQARSSTRPSEAVARALAISWDYYGFRPFRYVSRNLVAFSVGAEQKTVTLDMYQSAMVAACGQHAVAFPESLATYTARVIPTLAPAYLQLLDAATALIECGLLERISEEEARRRRAARKP